MVSAAGWTSLAFIRIPWNRLLEERSSCSRPNNFGMALATSGAVVWKVKSAV
jgi:hypothetical protein